MGRLLGRIADFIRETDKILLILCTTASLYGVFAVFSSTRFESSVRPTFVQAFCLCAGIGAALFISAFNFTNYTRRWLLAAILGVVPVILTFFIGIAPAGTDDKAWLDLGFTAFQPSELMKICFIITFSAHLSSVKDKINKPSVLLPACLHGGFPVVLIILQGDFGTALVFAAMFIIMLWSAGVSWKYFVGAFSGAQGMERLLSKYKKLSDFVKKRESHVFFDSFFHRIISCLPGDIVSMYFGAAKLDFSRYFWGSMLGIVPGTITASFMGESIRDPLSPKFIISLSVTLFMSVLSIVIYRISNKKKNTDI